MENFKKVICIILALITVFGCGCIALAEETPENEQTEEPTQIDYLDTSAIDGKLYAYKGIETYFVVYPFPEEAESRFDIFSAQITCSDESVLDFRPDKGEQARFGSVLITGKKLGSATVTVTEPESGKSCEVEVIVIPAIGYYIRNFFLTLDYLPFMIFMRIAAVLSKIGLIK